MLHFNVPFFTRKLIVKPYKTKTNQFKIYIKIQKIDSFRMFFLFYHFHTITAPKIEAVIFKTVKNTVKLFISLCQTFI